MRVVRFNVGPLDNNTYVLVDDATGDCAVVDPAFESAGVLEEADRNGWKTVLVLNTHAHLDHVVENALFVERTGAPLAMHAADLPLLRAMDTQAEWFGIETPRMVEPARLLADGEEVAIGAGSVHVIHTPGHSPGGICFVGYGWAVVGDVLFRDSIGRADLPGGDMDALIESIRTRLLTLPDETVVYPGHGPETTIGRERKSNPFIQP